MKIQKILFIIVLVGLFVFSANSSKAFLYPAGPVFDPLNVAGEAAGTVATVANKIVNLQITINDKISSFKRSLAEILGGILGGKRKPGKVAGARKIAKSELVDYSTEEEKVRKLIYELFWLYPEPDYNDATERRTRIISQDKRKAYELKRVEFHQDNLIEVWAAVRGLEEELVNLKTQSENIKAEIENLTDPKSDGAGGDGLNEHWKNTYEAYKTYDALYALIEELTALKTQLIMSKAIRYDVKPIYKEETSSSLLIFKSKSSYASQDLIVSAPPSPPSFDMPFSGKEALLEELKIFTPAYKKIAESLEYHNLMKEMPQYQNVFKRYEEMLKLHERAKEMLAKSDECAISFLGRYYKNPVDIWSGISLDGLNNDHSKRSGISGWAYNGLFVAAKAVEADEKQAQYTQVDADGNSYAKENNSIENPVLSDGQSAEVNNTEINQVDEEGFVTNPSPVETLDIEQQREKEEAEAKNIEESGDNFSSDEEKEKADAEIREAKQLYWNIGFEVIDDFINNSDKWYAIEKNNYSVWGDQKIFYNSYLAEKFSNISKYLTSMDFKEEISNIAKKIVEKKEGVLSSRKEVEYNSLTLIIIDAIAARKDAQMLLEEISFVKSYNEDKSFRDNKIMTSSDEIAKTLTNYNNNYADLLSVNDNVVSTSKTIIAPKFAEVQNLFFDISLKVDAAILKQQTVLEDATNNLEIKDLPVVEYSNVIENYSNVVETIASVEAMEQSKQASDSDNIELDNLYKSLQENEKTLSDVITELTKILADDAAASNIALDPNDVVIIKGAKNIIDAAEAKIITASQTLQNDTYKVENIYENINLATINSDEIIDYVKLISTYKESIVEGYKNADKAQSNFSSYKFDVEQNLSLMLLNQTSLDTTLAYIERNNTIIQDKINNDLLTSNERQSLEDVLSVTKDFIIDISLLKHKLDNLSLELREAYDNNLGLAINNNLPDDSSFYEAALNNSLDNIENLEEELDVKVSDVLKAKETSVSNIINAANMQEDTVLGINGNAINALNKTLINQTSADAESLVDIIDRVVFEITDKNKEVEEIIEKYISNLDSVALENYNHDKHQFFIDMYNNMFNEIEELQINVRISPVAGAERIAASIYEDAMLRLKIAGTDGQRAKIDETFFVGVSPKLRDFRSPAKALETAPVHPRELVYFDEVDWVNVGGLDNNVSKYKFLSYGAKMPLIWEYMLKDKSFVEKDFDLDLALSKYADNSIDDFINVGRYPCLINYNNKDFVLKISGAKEATNLIKRLRNKVGNPSSFYTYTISPKSENDTFEYAKCLNEDKVIVDNVDIDSIIANLGQEGFCKFGYFVKNKISTIPAKINVDVLASDLPDNYANLSDFQKDIMLKTTAQSLLDGSGIDIDCASYSLKEEKLSSELGMFLQSSTKFAEFADEIFLAADTKKKSEKVDENDKTETFDDYIVENLPFKKNLIGDFLRAAEEEAEYKKSVDELAQKIEIIKWGEKNEDGSKKSDGLYDKLDAIGFDDLENLSLADQEKYDAAYEKLKDAKKILSDAAMFMLNEVVITDDEESNLYNPVAKDRKERYEHILWALEEDDETLISLSDSPASKEEIVLEIKQEEVNRAADLKYQKEAEEEMQNQIDNFEEPYCPAY